MTDGDRRTFQYTVNFVGSGKSCDKYEALLIDGKLQNHAADYNQHMLECRREPQTTLVANNISVYLPVIAAHFHQVHFEKDAEAVQEPTEEKPSKPDEPEVTPWDPTKVIRQEDPDAPKERRGNFSGGKLS